MHKTLPLAAALAIALSGCMTAQQWTKNPPLTTVAEEQAMGGDNLIAFGQVNEDHAPLQAGSLILVGEIYWFAIDKNESAELQRVLTNDLPQQYLFTDTSGTQDKPVLTIVLDAKDRQRFSSEACLRYDTTDPTEVQKLQALDFKPLKAGAAPAYGRCLPMHGSIFIKPPNLPYDQRFQKNLPIEIKQRKEKRGADMGNIVSNLVTLPATLSADTVGSVIMTPALIRAGMDYFNKKDTPESTNP